MENNSNSKERQKEVQKLTFIVLAVMTVLIIGYAAYGLITESISMLLFGIMLGGFVVVYIVLTDIVEPFRLGLFQDLARERRLSENDADGCDWSGSAHILDCGAGF